MERTYLSEDCWIDVGYYEPHPDHYEEIKQHIPDEDQEWYGYGKTHYLKRRTISFGNSYSYSGQTKDGHDFPPVLLEYLDVANEYARSIGWSEFNQCLVNWYPDGDAYISAHSDDEHDLYLDESGQTVVYGISLTQGEGNDRKFRLRKAKEKGQKSKPPIELDVRSGHGDVIVMGGRMQNRFTHEIPKQKTNKGRISMTFRTISTDY